MADRPGAPAANAGDGRQAGAGRGGAAAGAGAAAGGAGARAPENNAPAQPTVARLDAVRLKKWEEARLKNHDEGKLMDRIPLGNKLGRPWERRCLQHASLLAEIKMLQKMNGLRISTWRMCVEKRRKYLSDMLFGSSMATLPDDCARRIAGFLPCCTAQYIAELWVSGIVRHHCLPQRLRTTNEIEGLGHSWFLVPQPRLVLEPAGSSNFWTLPEVVQELSATYGIGVRTGQNGKPVFFQMDNSEPSSSDSE